jgi:hypothetical protein
VLRVFGPNVAHAGDEFHGSGFHRVFQFTTRAGAGCIPLLGRNLVSILRFSVFFFSWENRIIKELPKIKYN